MSRDAAVQRLLERFEPSSSELLDVLRRRVDDSMLDEIAHADYGDDAVDHLIALKQIHATVDVAPLQWVPIEVLQLIRWSQPDDPSWKPGSFGDRGHLMRAFCCAILLRTAAEPENDGCFGGENQTIAQLVDSAIELDDPIENAALRFLCWRTLRLNRDDIEYPFFAMAILLLATHLGETDANRLGELAKWVVAEESRIRSASADRFPDDASAWLLGLTFFNLRHPAWKRLTKDILSNPGHACISDATREALTGVAQRVLGTSP